MIANPYPSSCQLCQRTPELSSKLLMLRHVCLTLKNALKDKSGLLRKPSHLTTNLRNHCLTQKGPRPRRHQHHANRTMRLRIPIVMMTTTQKIPLMNSNMMTLQARQRRLRQLVRHITAKPPIKPREMATSTRTPPPTTLRETLIAATHQEQHLC